MGSKMKNTKFMVKEWAREGGFSGPLFAILYIIFKSLNCIFAIFLTSKAIMILGENGEPLNKFLLVIGMISIYAVSSTIENFSHQKFYTSLFLFRILESPNLFIKQLKLPYEYVEGSQGKKDFEKANEAVGAGNDIGVEAAIRNLVLLIVDICCLVIFIIISASLHPLIMVLLLVTGAIRIIMDVKNRRWIINNQDKKNSFVYEKMYLYNRCLDNKIGKDVRIYNMKDWFSKKFDYLREKVMFYSKREESNSFKAQVIGLLSGIVRDVICYGYLIYRVTNGLSISEFVLYLGVIGGLNIWIKNIFDHYGEYAKNIIVVDNFRTYLEKEEIGKGKYDLTIPQSAGYTYVFENVSFAYEDGTPLFENLNLTINAGEKIALVGANGAGKTTFIKLMSGLYKPKSGRILVNGIDISRVDPKKLLKITGVVFQDTKVFPQSIEKNISCKLGKYIQKDLIDESLKGANFYEVIQDLPLKEKTILTKNLDKNGVELSGGQYQKLMLSRALYKNAPVLILDEPTAALDPLAEADMYLRYNEFTKGKTSVFISHRLSSTQFCDRVIFLEKGKIKQDGNHEELLEKDGPYRDMFLAQAHYYREEEVI